MRKNISYIVIGATMALLSLTIKPDLYDLTFYEKLSLAMVMFGLYILGIGVGKPTTEEI